MAVISFSHFGLTCNDPIKMEKFYSKHFDFKRTRVFTPGPEQVVMIKSGSMYIELFKSTKVCPLPLPKESGYKFSGWRHICFLVDDLDAKLKSMGNDARLTLGPLDMSNYIKGMRVCWISDPEGNIIELNQGYVDDENPPPLE